MYTNRSNLTQQDNSIGSLISTLFPKGGLDLSSRARWLCSFRHPQYKCESSHRKREWATPTSNIAERFTLPHSSTNRLPPGTDRVEDRRKQPALAMSAPRVHGKHRSMLLTWQHGVVDRKPCWSHWRLFCLIDNTANVILPRKLAALLITLLLVAPPQKRPHYHG